MRIQKSPILDMCFPSLRDARWRCSGEIAVDSAEGSPLLVHLDIATWTCWEVVFVYGFFVMGKAVWHALTYRGTSVGVALIASSPVP